MEFAKCQQMYRSHYCIGEITWNKIENTRFVNDTLSRWNERRRKKTYAAITHLHLKWFIFSFLLSSCSLSSTGLFSFESDTYQCADWDRRITKFPLLQKKHTKKNNNNNLLQTNRTAQSTTDIESSCWCHLEFDMAYHKDYNQSKYEQTRSSNFRYVCVHLKWQVFDEFILF